MTATAKPRLLYYRMMNYMPENRRLLDAHFDVVELETPADDGDEVLAALDACCAPLGHDVGAAKLDRCPNLAAIITNTTGVPHIDMDATAARGVRVFSLKDEQAFLATITPTAEHAWGLLLALTRRTPWAHQTVLGGVWDRYEFGAAPRMLSRMTLGIVGYGRLGRRVARYGRAFGMPVRYADPFVDVDDGVAEKAGTLAALTAWADVLSLHVPATPETRHLIDAGVLAGMKPGACLINTARAELIDEAALLEGLRSGRIGGYASDVLAGEFAPGFRAADHPLVRHAAAHENVLLTPHIGGSTRDAWRETQARVIEMAAAFFADRR